MDSEQIDLIEYLLSAFIVDQRRRPEADREAAQRHIELARSTISALNELRETA